MAGCDIAVRVTPRSSRNRVALEDGGIRVWVTAPPAEGEANAAVLRTLAKSLGIAPSRLQIIRGETSRDKTIRVDGLAREEIDTKLGS